MATKRSYALMAVLILAAMFGSLCFGDEKPPADKPASTQRMTKETRMMVIRSLNAEYVFVRKPLPIAQKGGMTIKNGVITPDEQQLQMMIAQYGMAAKPGDRAQITAIEIKNDRIHLELNGGGKKKQKWYQHIEVGGMGGTTPISRDTSDPVAKGTYVDLVFDKYVPEMTGNDIREILAPLLDFHAKSAAEAYLDTVPPQVKEAVKNHQVLVGMNREMVGYAKGRPDQKIREKDEQGNEYEEWIYGRPPQEVAFVRFVGDEVARLELMKVDGTKVIRTEKEVDITPMKVEALKKKQEAESPIDQGPGKKPSLKRPGEEGDKQQ